MIKLKAIAYDNFNATPTQNSTCEIEISIENENDNKPRLMYPRDNDQPVLLPLPNSSSSSENSTTRAPTKLLLTRLVANDLDAPPSLTYSLERQIRVEASHQLELVNMFEMDTQTGSLYMVATSANATGLYALIVEVSDKQSSSGGYNDDDDESEDESDDNMIQKSRFYVFVALGVSSNNSDIVRLREIFNFTRLNDDSLSIDSDEYDDDSIEAKSPDFRFERVLALLKQVLYTFKEIRF